MAETAQELYFKLSPQSHSLVYKLYFYKKHSKLPPGQYLWNKHFKSPQALIFGRECCQPHQKTRGGWYCVIVLIYLKKKKKTWFLHTNKYCFSDITRTKNFLNQGNTFLSHTIYYSLTKKGTFHDVFST